MIEGPLEPLPEGTEARCRGCGAEIFWTLSQKGKRMPVDVKPQSYFVLSNQGTYVRAVSQRGHLSHFATCPNAKDFRK